MLAFLERSSRRRQRRRTVVELRHALCEILREIVGDAGVVLLSAERRTEILLARERCGELGAKSFEVGAVRRRGGLDRFARRARRLGLGLAAVGTQLRAEAGSEPSFGVRHLRLRHSAHLLYNLKSCPRLRSAGPRMTMNIAGKMKTTIGNNILIGAFIAFSSAAA